MLTFSTYESAYGVGYRIYQNGLLVIDQPFKPGAPGFVGMTQAEAEEHAAADIAAMTPPSE